MRKWTFLSLLFILLWGYVQVYPSIPKSFWRQAATSPPQETIATAWGWIKRRMTSRHQPIPEMALSVCMEKLKEAGLKFRVDTKPIPDGHAKRGCHRRDAVRFSKIGDVTFGGEITLSCKATLALTNWVQNDMQDLAELNFGEKVSRISYMGTYSCRNIAGSSNPSQHSYANAIDIGGFRLKSGKRVSVLNHWDGAGKKSAFLKSVGKRACSQFQLVLSPDYNKAHRDHFHFDMGRYRRCRINPSFTS